MKVLSAIFALVLLTIGTISSRAATHLVLMNNFSFTPANLTVDVGDTVTWTNTVITGHDTVCQGVWASPLLPRRGTFSFTLNAAGTFNYVCSPHINFGMTGRITVRAPVNNPPTATIISPQNGQAFQVGESITVDVNAADDNGVTKVDLFLDGGSQQTDTTSPYQFSLNNVPAGSHMLLARATDAGGLTGQSSITINVQFANPAPTVTLTSPTNSARFNEPAILVFSADVIGSVERVEFLTNSVVMAIDATAPYSVTNNLVKGAYTVVARAIGTDTQIGNSAPADIEVGEHIPQPPAITIISPENELHVGVGSYVVMVAEAVDGDGTIARVQFATPTNSLGVIDNPSISNRFELTTVFPAEGVQTIFAVATDDTGLTSTSAPISLIVKLPARRTYMTNLPPDIIRLGYFGSSGVPYIFEYSYDMTNWFPFRTNQFYRRIFFFDVVNNTNEPMRIIRPRPL